MRKIHEVIWYGIRFDSFITPDIENIASVEFYHIFYNIFFKKYHDWLELDTRWLDGQTLIAKLILDRIRNRTETNRKILSVSCGIGAIERVLLKSELPGCELHLSEVSNAPLQWIMPMIDPKQVYVGLFPVCVPDEMLFDYIYASSVDYCFDEVQWVAFLNEISKRLKVGGMCLVVSDLEMTGTVEKTKRVIIDGIKMLLHKTGLRHLGQFWGYQRTRGEHQNAMRQAGFEKIKDGFVQNDGRYWIGVIKTDRLTSATKPEHTSTK